MLPKQVNDDCKKEEILIFYNKVHQRIKKYEICSIKKKKKEYTHRNLLRCVALVLLLTHFLSIFVLQQFEAL